MSNLDGFIDKILSSYFLIFFISGIIFIFFASLQNFKYKRNEIIISSTGKIILYILGFILFFSSLVVVFSKSNTAIHEGPVNIIAKSSDERLIAIEGIWKGQNSQIFEKDTINIHLKMILKIENNIVQGDIEIISTEMKESEKNFSVNGYLYADKFLLLRYENKNKSMYSFGYYLLELQADGTTLKGRFIGYGAKSNKIIDGEIIYNKEK